MSSPKETALSACRQLMKPIIGILLRNGITYKDLVTLCKQLYVEVATKEFGIRGRETNLSRVAILTGIDRKEVARIKDSLHYNEESETTQHHQDRLTRILSGWHLDPDYLDKTGKPLIIPINGEHISFAQLARKYGGDIPSSAVLKELKTNNIVEEDTAGNVKVMKRYFMPAQSDPQTLLRAGSVFNDLGTNIEHNLYKANKIKNKFSHFERRASNSQMPQEASAAFRAFIELEGQLFLEKVDAWLTAHEQPTDNSKSPTTPTIRLGVGAYLIENSLEPKTSLETKSETPGERK
jgi:hypothetical protein